eukprot:6736141-Prymnesium_polylepis.1
MTQLWTHNTRTDTSRLRGSVLREKIETISSRGSHSLCVSARVRPRAAPAAAQLVAIRSRQPPTCLKLIRANLLGVAAARRRRARG